ncbi:membrane protein [Streptomyces sp. WM6378]|nr:membrane protein [Streptomyces sp. WM6378]
MYVLTAVLLTPAQFPSVLGDDYPEACAALGLGPYAQGYGLVLGQDGTGARWTVVVDDVSLVAVAIASWDCGMEYELSPDERTVVAALPGWPLELAISAPDIPAPHDPVSEAEGRRPLAPPDTTEWGPAQRRLGADEIALQWAAWREQLGDDEFGPAPDEAPTSDEPDSAGAAPGGAEPAEASSAEPEATATPARSVPQEEPAGRPVASGAGGGAREGGGSANADPDEDSEHPDAGAEMSRVRRVLTELHGYLDSPPPVGRVRSAFAPGGARMLRADGPGWSLVARTDDIAFVLLDDSPGEVHPVGRGAELPALLEALEAMAVRPS